MLTTRSSISEAMKKARAKEKELTLAYLADRALEAGLDEWDGFAVDYSADETIKVETKFSYIIALDTNVSKGIQMIADWVNNLQPNINRKIKKILSDVLNFKTSGSVSKSRLNKLCSYDFEDEQYREAVKIIQQNMRVVDKKSYTEVFIRQDVEEDRGKGLKMYTEWVSLETNYAGM
jgi:hypothetical protein